MGVGGQSKRKAKTKDPQKNVQVTQRGNQSVLNPTDTSSSKSGDSESRIQALFWFMPSKTSRKKDNPPESRPRKHWGARLALIRVLPSHGRGTYSLSETSKRLSTIISGRKSSLKEEVMFSVFLQCTPFWSGK